MVAFDAVGPSGGAGTVFTATPGTWTHVNSGNGILIGVTVFGGGSNTVTGVTYGGVTIPLVKFQTSDGGANGGIAVYGLTGATCPTGSNTVSVAFSDAPNNHCAGSISLSSAGAIGTPASAASASTSTSQTLSVPGTTAGGLVVGFAAFGGGSGASVLSGNNGVTAMFFRFGSNSSSSDNIVGGTVASAGGAQTIGFQTNGTADDWGIVGVEVLDAGGGAPTQTNANPGLARKLNRKFTRGRSGPKRATFPHPLSFTTAVTGTILTNVGPGGVVLRVWVITGHNGVGVNTGTFTTHGSSQPIQAPITTTNVNSRVYGAMEENNTNTTFTPLAGTTMVDNNADAVNSACYATIKATSLTGTPGATTFGTATAFTSGSVALAEVLPGGTLAEDPSSPPGVFATNLTQLTTAPFMPPQGALLVAAFAGEGDGVNAQTVSVTDVAGLTWVPVVFSCIAASGFSGIWVATAPLDLPPPLTPRQIPSGRARGQVTDLTRATYT